MYARRLAQLALSAPARRGLASTTAMRKEVTPAPSSKQQSANIQDRPVQFPSSEPQYDLPGFREPGSLPTNYEIATGTERFEYLHRLAGQDPWEDLKPIVLTQKGTKASPVVIRGVDPVRYIGCTGYPVGSHELLWLTVTPGGPKHFDRCPDCGQVFKYIQEKGHDHGHDHHH